MSSQSENELVFPEFAQEELSGDFKRDPTFFHDRVSSEEDSPFQLEPGRYILIIAYACPWSHICVIVRHLKGLDDVVGLSIVKPVLNKRGWIFTDEDASKFGVPNLTDLYQETNPSHSLVGTVPILWDSKTRKVVCDAQIEICEMFNDVFPQLVSEFPVVDLWPEEHRTDMQKMHHFMWHYVNNGVYRCGFAKTQLAYETRARQLFVALDWLDERLKTRRYLFGDEPVESDWQLFVVLLRFDFVYYVLFKCNIRHIFQYENLSGYLRDLYQKEGISETTDIDEVKAHYFKALTSINPRALVPVGPNIDLDAPHGRERLGGVS